MTLERNREQWTDLGRLDPFWAMTGTNRFNRWDVEAFLQTGDQQVAELMMRASDIGLPSQKNSVLDFGCGVGRLARGFRNHFRHYVGLDISEPLIVKAEEIHAELPNTEFAPGSSEALPTLPDESFDMVHSWGVLQHIADRSIVQHILHEFVRLVRSEGLIVFSALHDIKVAYRLQPRRRLYALLKAIGVSEVTLYQRLKLYPQEVHFIPESQVTGTLEKAGARVLKVLSAAQPSDPHQVRIYFATK
ncbi:MAG: type 11 methyltransferase [Chloroflexota bacterium]|nr:class I SAM-dependent methyltransferase [Caldilinea sp.]GIK71377.1 MAG: type 11 methyltransferase [Chloroflexota bacterium]